MKKIIALCLIVCLSLSLSPFSSVATADWNWERIRSFIWRGAPADKEERAVRCGAVQKREEQIDKGFVDTSGSLMILLTCFLILREMLEQSKARM